MPRKNKILIRTGTGAPSAADFVTSEPAWDSTNGKLYVRNAAGSMVEIGSGGGTTELVFTAATTSALPATGDAAKLYITTDTNRTYRWVDSTTKYVEVSGVSAYDSRWDLFLPGAPTSVSGTVGNAQSVVSWTAPTGVATQTPITNYSLQYAASPFTSWTTVSRSASTATSATVTGLTNGTAYQFRVAAVNAVGQGAYSTASASVTPVSGDANFASVLLLLHGESMVDSSAVARTLTASGASISTTQKKFGNSSISIGSGQYVSVPGNSAFNMSGDFTLEWFHYLNSATAQGWVIGGDANSSGYFMLGLNLTGSQQLWLGQAAVGWPVQFGSVPLAANTWQHVAISRSGSSNRLYIDGTLVGSAITDSTNWTTNPSSIWIGSQSGGASMSGYLDEFRWTVGTARGYTGSSITVPASAYPDAVSSDWTPASLSPTLWLDASVSGSLYDATSGGSLVSSGGTVRRWEDQSGNGNHVTGSSGPTRSVSSVNSKDSLAFSSQLLTRSGLNLSSATAASLFAVIKFASSGNQIAVAFGTDGSYGGLTLEANLRSAGQHSATFGNNSLGSENQATGGTVSNVTKSFGAVYGSSTGTLYIGGSSAATVSRSQSLGSSSGFSVGAYFASGYALSGNICEIVYVPRAMTAGEISVLQSYFASKWGV